MYKHFKSIISFFLLFLLSFNCFSPLIVFASDDDKPNYPQYDSDKWALYDNSDITNVILDQLLNKGIHEGDADFYENFIR